MGDNNGTVDLMYGSNHGHTEIFNFPEWANANTIYKGSIYFSENYVRLKDMDIIYCISGQWLPIELQVVYVVGFIALMLFFICRTIYDIVKKKKVKISIAILGCMMIIITLFLSYISFSFMISGKKGRQPTTAAPTAATQIID